MMGVNYRVNDLVKIIDRKKYKKMCLTGAIGTIREIYRAAAYPARYGIAIEGKHNGYSASGLFWFTGIEIIPSEPGELEVPKSTDNIEEDEPMLPNYKPVKIRFLDDTDGKLHTYALYPETDAALHDKVVVNTGHHGFAVAELVQYSDNPHEKVSCGREIVCTVDFAAFEMRKRRAQRMAELLGEMNELAKSLQATALFELLAEKSPEMRQRLEEYNGLAGRN